MSSSKPIAYQASPHDPNNKGQAYHILSHLSTPSSALASKSSVLLLHSKQTSQRWQSEICVAKSSKTSITCKTHEILPLQNKNIYTKNRTRESPQNCCDISCVTINRPSLCHHFETTLKGNKTYHYHYIHNRIQTINIQRHIINIPTLKLKGISIYLYSFFVCWLLPWPSIRNTYRYASLHSVSVWHIVWHIACTSWSCKCNDLGESTSRSTSNQGLILDS